MYVCFPDIDVHGAGSPIASGMNMIDGGHQPLTASNSLYTPIPGPIHVPPSPSIPVIPEQGDQRSLQDYEWYWGDVPK